MKMKSVADNPFAINIFANLLVAPNCALPQPTGHADDASERNHKKYFPDVSIFAFARHLYQ